jgi:hypothetical protein
LTPGKSVEELRDVIQHLNSELGSDVVMQLRLKLKKDKVVEQAPGKNNPNEATTET